MNLGDWSVHLEVLFKQPYFVNLLDFLRHQATSGKIIYPPKSQWFRAFELSSFAATKVVLLGQDPYHNEGQAQGLSFSVAKGVKIPPSLHNIYQELQSDLKVTAPQNGDLSDWAKQGVLLLNSVLTVEKNAPASHSYSGWVDFTDAVIDILNAKKQNLVFIFWGRNAQQKSALINQNKHLLLTAAHPSPFSAHRGFFSCKHFSKTNIYLQNSGQTPIKWAL